MRVRKVKTEHPHRDRKILCPRCGYDIKGMPDRPCSECGLFIKSKWREGRFGAGAPLRVSLWQLALAWYALMAFQILTHGGPLFWAQVSLMGFMPKEESIIPLWWYGIGGACVLGSALMLIVGVRWRNRLRYGASPVFWVHFGGSVLVVVVTLVWGLLLKGLVPPPPA